MSTKKRFNRREAIGVIGAAAGAALAFGCSDSSTSPSTTTSTASTTTTTTGTTNAACAVTPQETLGPYPSLTDLIRSDIRESKSGTVLTLTVKVVNANASCAAVSGANVEIWQCDAGGNYSEYGTQTAQTYLRGIQTTNSNGEVTFTTIYPGWYQGRATHIHLEVTIGGVEEGDADRLSRKREQHGVRYGRLRIQRSEPDVECLGWHLRRQSVVGARHAGRDAGQFSQAINSALQFQLCGLAISV